MTVSQHPPDATPRSPLTDRIKKKRRFAGFEIERTVKVGDLLTSASIFISVIAILVTWVLQSGIQERQQADYIRNAAASTLAKLVRWGELSGSIFDEVQPIIIDTSKLLLDPKENVASARDYFWKEFQSARIRVQKKILDEQIEGAFVNLYGYNPFIKKALNDTIEKLRSNEEKMLTSFLKDCDDAISSFSDKQKMAESRRLHWVIH